MDDVTTQDNVAAAGLRRLIERTERLEEQKATIQDDMREVMAEARGAAM